VPATGPDTLFFVVSLVMRVAIAAEGGSSRHLGGCNYPGRMRCQRAVGAAAMVALPQGRQPDCAHDEIIKQSS
jgi:hypothetical protein